MNLVDPVFISQGSYDRLRELKGLLGRASIEAEIVLPPGCNPNH